MANRLKVQEQQAILDLNERGWTIRRIARELRVSRNTVRSYLRNVVVGKNVIRVLVAGNMTTSLQVMLEDDRENCRIAARGWKVRPGSLNAPEARVVLIDTPQRRCVWVQTLWRRVTRDRYQAAWRS
jgi:lambda repressor-like predicted transcriptional regulator